MAKQNNNSKLRFAALIRVSTERQAKQGESLRTQRKDNTEAASRLGGEIVAWYGGQEHGTPGYEKAEVDRLLSDAKSKSRTWNAVIVADVDRWSRDNIKSKQGLQVLRDEGIRFFADRMEFDLFNPDHCFVLGMQAEVGELFAAKGKRKSIENKIERAKRGIPTCGSKPYGRTYDKKTGKWGVDEKKKADIEAIARRYLAGEGFGTLAEDYELSAGYIHRVLTRRCGNIWYQTFHKQNGEVVVVKTIVPRLLPQATIDAILKKAQANKTYTHGEIKNRYLLSRMIFCSKCNKPLFGQTSFDKKYGYYRHKKVDNCKPPRYQIKVDVIEDMVMRYLFSMFGNPVAIQRAVERAEPDRIKLKQDQERIEQIEKELKAISKGRERILDLVGRDKITEEQADKQLDKLNKDETRLNEEKSRLLKSTANRPNKRQIQTVAKQTHKRFELLKKKLRIAKRYYAYNFDAMTYEEKRGLCEMVFGGNNTDGKRLGIYVDFIDKKTWQFNIHGHLINLLDVQPMSQGQAKAFGEPICGNVRTQEKFLTKYTPLRLKAKQNRSWYVRTETMHRAGLFFSKSRLPAGTSRRRKK